MLSERSASSATPVVVGLGEILWDLLPGGRQLGGAPANFAYHANALGAAGTVVSRVGGDELGRDVLQRLGALRLETRYVSVDPEHPTGTVDVRLSEGGVPDYVIHADVAWDYLRFTPDLAELASRADAVCFGTLGQRASISRGAIRQFLSALRPRCLRVLDINLRQHYFDRPLVHELLMGCDVLKLNDGELPVVASLLGISGNGTDAIRNLMSRYPLRLVALTRGPAGSLLQGVGEASDQPGLPLSGGGAAGADTVGAGDAFTAALVMGLLRGLPLDQINAVANRLAGYVCTQAGATPAVPGEFRRALERAAV